MTLGAAQLSVVWLLVTAAGKLAHVTLALPLWDTS
jgi:hypothetical protein